MKLQRESEWISIFQTGEDYLIQIKHLTLVEAGIPAVIFDQRDSSYNMFGYLYLKVRQEDALEATKLLNLPHE